MAFGDLRHRRAGQYATDRHGAVGGDREPCLACSVGDWRLVEIGMMLELIGNDGTAERLMTSNRAPEPSTCPLLSETLMNIDHHNISVLDCCDGDTVDALDRGAIPGANSYTVDVNHTR